MERKGGRVGQTVKMVDHGPDATRFNIVLMSEGYRAQDIPRFICDSEWFVHVLFTTPPFNEFPHKINVYRIEVESNEAGAADPACPECSGTNQTPDTYFNASFCSQGIERLLQADEKLVLDTAAQYVPAVQTTILLVNHPKPGGSGGSYSTVSASRAWPWARVAIHEMGHSFFGLGDEYDYELWCQDGKGIYKGGEPSEPNLTIMDVKDQVKWEHLVAQTTNYPTVRNPDCSKCDDRGILPGPVGAYEGGGLFHCGIFRPEAHCMMRDLSPFCAVCREHIRTLMAVYDPPSTPGMP